MLRKRIFGLLALITIILGWLFITLSFQGSYDSPAEARQNCNSHTLWLVEHDHPFHNLYEVESSYQGYSVDKNESFSCTKATADRMVRFESAFSFSFYFLLLPIWLPIVLIVFVLWWLKSEVLQIRKTKPNKKKH